MNRAVLLAAALCVTLSAHALRHDWKMTVKSAPSTSRMYAADLNLDGRPDLVSRNNAHQILVALTSAQGTFGNWTVVHTGTYVSHVRVGDFDEDGDDDIAVADTVLNAITVLPSNGDGTFGTPIVSTLDFSPTEIEVGDFNNDGLLDLAARSYSASYLVVLAGNGAGSFAEVSRRALALSAFRSTAGDLDGDGNLDVVIAHDDPTFYEIHYGIGNGSFEGAITTASAEEYTSELVIADVDDDGDRDIASTEFLTSTATIVRNHGGRVLSQPESYPLTPYPYPYGSAFDIVVGDYNGDSHTDIVVTLTNNRELVVLPGDGSGTFGPRNSLWTAPVLPMWMTPGDFTGDGRIDIAATSSSHGIMLFEQDPGAIEIYTRLETPTITQGQAAQLFVLVDSPDGVSGSGIPAASGTVTVKRDGGVILATKTIDERDWYMPVDVPSLPLGTHSLVVEYSGDENYRPATSDPVTVKVIAEATTTRLVSSMPEPMPYGMSIHFTATVTSPLDAPLNGLFYLTTDGQRETYGSSGPSASFTKYDLSVGTHSFFVDYMGSADQPPSRSNVVHRTVRKARTTARWSGWTEFVVRQGQTPSALYVDVQSEAGRSVSGSGNGTVQIYDGATLVHTTTPGTYFTMPPLAPGTHYLRAVYSGTENYERSSSDPFKYTVVASGTFHIYVSRVTSSSWIEANGLYAGSASTFRCYMKVNSGPWTSQTCFEPSIDVHIATSGSAYSFRFEAYNASNQLLAASDVGTYVDVTFTDTAGLVGRSVKAAHVQELLTGVNALRSSAGLAPVVLADFGAGQYIRAAHLQSLRTGLNEARVALLGSALTFSAGATSGLPMQAIHILELRDALQ